MVGMDFAAPYIAKEEKMLIEGSNRNLSPQMQWKKVSQEAYNTNFLNSDLSYING